MPDLRPTVQKHGFRWGTPNFIKWIDCFRYWILLKRTNFSLLKSSFKAMRTEKIILRSSSTVGKSSCLKLEFALILSQCYLCTTATCRWRGSSALNDFHCPSLMFQSWGLTWAHMSRASCLCICGLFWAHTGTRAHTSTSAQWYLFSQRAWMWDTAGSRGNDVHGWATPNIGFAERHTSC